MNGTRGKKYNERKDIKKGQERNVCRGIADLGKSDFTVSLYKHVSRYHGEPEKQIRQQISSRVKIKRDAFVFQGKDKCNMHRVNPRLLH